MADHITILPLTALHECPANPRQHYDQAALQELADSLKSQGLLQPIVVRPLPGQPLHHEIVFGHRRFRAAQLAGLDSVPAILRDMTDQQVAEAQIAENLARADVNALEEAQSYHRLMREFGVTAKQIIEQTGKSKSYIYGRLKLLQLADEPRQALLAGQIDAEVAGLISRMPQAVQADALDQVLIDGEGGPRGLSYRDAKQALRHLVVDVGAAPFPLDLMSLAGKAACLDCAHLASNDPAMADMAPLSCARRACYQEKVGAWVQQQVAEAKAVGRNVVEGEDAVAATHFWPAMLHGYTAVDGEIWVRQTERADLRSLLESTGQLGDAELLVLPENRGGPALIEVVCDAVLSECKRRHIAATTAPDQARQPSDPGDAYNNYAERQKAEREALLAELTPTERILLDADHWKKVESAIASRLRGTPRTADDLRLIVATQLECGESLTDGTVARLFGWEHLTDGMTQEEEERAEVAKVRELSADDLALVLMGWALDNAGSLHWRTWQSADNARAAAMERLALATRFGVDVHDPEDMVQPAAVQTPAQVGDLFDGATSTPSTAARGGDGARSAADTAATPSTAAPAAKGAKGQAVRYRCPLTGSTWTGRGLKPAWVRAALEGGKTLADLSVDQIQTDEAGCAGNEQTDDAGVTAGERATEEA